MKPNNRNKKINSSQSGAAIVEFAFSIFPFMLVMTCIVDIIRLVLFHLTVQHVAGMAVRELILPPSSTISAAGIQPAFANMERTRNPNSVRTTINNIGEEYGLKLQGSSTFVQLMTDPAIGWQSLVNNAAPSILGDTGQLVSLKIEYPVQFIWGIVQYTVEGLAFGRVEPQRQQ